MEHSDKSILQNYDETKRLWYWDGEVLHHDGHPRYEISATQFQTPEQLVHWIDHLSEKNWVTKEDLVWLTRAFKEHNL
jgi:hypothetical protein